jgi:hypothetical protein
MPTITVEIDCPPGSSRPDTYFRILLSNIQESTILNNEIKEHVYKNWDNAQPVSKIFGNWTWELPSLEIKEKDEMLRDFIMNILTEFYNNGYIRYAGVS